MFLKNQDFVEIKIYFKQNGYKFLALTQNEIDKRVKEKKLTEDQVKTDFRTLNVNMSVLTWGSYNDFQSNASQITPEGTKYFDYRVYKEDRLKKLIKSWDALGEDNKPVPVNERTILSLAPAIGDAIVRGYDEMTFYDEETEKK